jgi:hypothetical protein
MRSSSLRGMDSQTENYKYKYNIVDFNDCVIILTVFYVYFDISYINVLIDGMNKNGNGNENARRYRTYSRICPTSWPQHRSEFSTGYGRLFIHINTMPTSLSEMVNEYGYRIAPPTENDYIGQVTGHRSQLTHNSLMDEGNLMLQQAVEIPTEQERITRGSAGLKTVITTTNSVLSITEPCLRISTKSIENM